MEVNMDSSEEAIIAFCEKHATGNPVYYGNEMKLNYGLDLLSLKQQKKLLDDQNQYNTDILKANKKLVYATLAAVLVALVIGLFQIFLLRAQVNDAENIASSGLMFSLVKDFRAGASSGLIYAIATDQVPLLYKNGGKFSDEQLDNYLIEYELLAQAYDQKLITKDMISVAFSYDIERAYQNKEVMTFINETRKDNNDNSIYEGFISLAELFNR